ncbi:Activator of stress genes 1 [Colletotrichum orbiculare MAFF 240422]|uniref:Activator of stress genes 1 n=1 Tax=Colletotrichum orbiculare (strain 104-T / ATCC 96160 / CBS 514.97 / LARS 414 / MAFF 240422) TaxID=1213857 RepID=A0A484FC63_COLOR|nr:Activator of stress genes 1 [Colletotrichum orbiculare MAFF 240422]
MLSLVDVWLDFTQQWGVFGVQGAEAQGDGERPKCAQCGINKIPCQWPEPRKRGPPKNLMSAMERRLIRTEDVLFALLSHTSDDQVMSALRELQSLGQGTDTARRCNFGTAYWETFPLDSVGQVKAWWRNQASSAAGEHRDLATSAAKTVSNVSPGIAQESDSEYHEDSNNDYREDSLLLATDHDDLAGCIFNIALLDTDDLPDVGSVKIRSGTELFPILSLLALRSDAKSIQALLAAQVYFISIMSLRHASSVGVLVSKAIYQAGMHRCPVRYAHLSPDECAMRKRIFWSFYVLDRFVSQSLGHPNGIQDSDIDVCSPGRPDLHEPVVQSTRPDSGTAADATILHLPVNHPDRISVTPDQQSREDPEDDQGEEIQDSETHTACSNGETSARAVAIHRHRQETQSVLEHHVRHSQLVGRILDVFHKSIHARDMKNQTILFLKADIAAWGNDLSRPRLGTDSASVPALSPDPTVFPYITHQYTILLLNRPFLSFDSRSADFQAAIQTCIGTANTIITAIEQYATSGGPLFWPGYMSAVWMSGLVLALSARLKVYSIAKATRGIRIVLGILSRMEKRWRTARDCRAVLSMLLENIESPRRQQKRPRSDAGDDESVVGVLRETTQATDSRPRTSKRRATHHLNLESQSGTKVDAPWGEGGHVYTPSKTRTPVVNFMKRSMDVDFGAPKEPLSRHSSHPNGYSIFTQSDLNSFSAPFLQETDLNMGAYFSPIPTTFPDRHRDPLTQQTDLFDNDYSTFDIFDGATWGSLLDIVNVAGGTTEP